jgi:hypothetical protein
MLFHDKGTVNIADVVRYTVTYDPHLDPSAHHGLLSRAPHLFTSKTLHLRIRNTASMLLRAAYLQGPYVLAVSVREDTFHANDETMESTSSWSPVYDHDLKTSTSFWTELPAGEKYLPWRMLIRRTWIIEVASQAIFANAPTSYTISIGHTKDSTRKAANGTDLITSSPGLKIQKETTADLWKTPVIQP